MERRTSVRRTPSRTHSRWNPTKEQIAMLENLYQQGMRTPNTQQIQEITSRLSVYGQIQGKNVFYWFQNHKARQRQKQKQQTTPYSNSFLHASHPISQNGLFSNVIFYDIALYILYYSIVSYLIEMNELMCMHLHCRP